MVIAKVSRFAKASPWKTRAKQRSMNSFWSIFDWCIWQGLAGVRLKHCSPHCSTAQTETEKNPICVFLASFNCSKMHIKWTSVQRSKRVCRRVSSSLGKAHMPVLASFNTTSEACIIMLLNPNRENYKKPVLTRIRSILLLNDSSGGALPLSRRRCAHTHKGLYSIIALESDFWWANQLPFAGRQMNFAFFSGRSSWM